MGRSDKTAGRSPDAEGEAAPEAPLPAALEPRTIEEWREAQGVETWAHEAAKQLRGWPIGQIVAADDYDTAIEAASKIEVS